MKAVLFDLDGTLVNSIPVILTSFQETFEEMKIPCPTEEEIKKGIGSHLKDIFRHFVPENRIQESIDIYRKYYLKKQYNGEVPLFSGVQESLKHLSQIYALGIVTTKLASVSRDLLQDLEILNLFQTVVGAEDVTNCKPDPEPLFLACSRMNISPLETIYVGDSVHDGGAAQNANMTFFGVTTGTGKREDLEQYGKVFQDISTCSKNFK